VGPAVGLVEGDEVGSVEGLSVGDLDGLDVGFEVGMKVSGLHRSKCGSTLPLNVYPSLQVVQYPCAVHVAQLHVADAHVHCLQVPSSLH